MSHFEYDEHSETIRLQPQNYLVARKRHGVSSGSWICDPDKAVPEKIAVMVFTLLHNSHNFCYGGQGSLVTELNNRLTFDSPKETEEHY